eukprot:6206696-Pleurochrysis_carterae.AAC.2
MPFLVPSCHTGQTSKSDRSQLGQSRSSPSARHSGACAGPDTADTCVRSSACVPWLRTGCAVSFMCAWDAARRNGGAIANVLVVGIDSSSSSSSVTCRPVGEATGLGTARLSRSA